MAESTVDPAQLQEWVDRMRTGDREAEDRLLRCISVRLTHLARRMLHGFPQVNRWEDTDDVLQNALVRLLRSLQKVRPDSVRSFFGLAAVHLRRELIDLSRHYARRFPPGERIPLSEPEEVEDPIGQPGDVDAWSRMHEGVEELPVEEREVFGLIFYHGWTQPEAAELFGVTERTVRRRWQSACKKLQARVRRSEPPSTI